jgi:hypothetical protein
MESHPGEKIKNYQSMLKQDAINQHLFFKQETSGRFSNVSASTFSNKPLFKSTRETTRKTQATASRATMMKSVA